MEGLYLHNLIFRALFTDSSAITLYVLLGWGEKLLWNGAAIFLITCYEKYWKKLEFDEACIKFQIVAILKISLEK